MAKATYKAEIEFLAFEDNYTEGENLKCDNSWRETYTADTKKDLKNLILAATYTDKWEDIDDEQINEYDFATEYHASYLANESNEGDASKAEIESWKKGETRLWAISCHILVTKLTETKAVL